MGNEKKHTTNENLNNEENISKTDSITIKRRTVMKGAVATSAFLAAPMINTGFKRAKAASDPGNIKIAWTSFGLNEPFNAALAKGATAEAKKIRGVEFILQDAQYKVPNQMQQLQGFIASKVDVVILHPTHPQEIAAGADEVIEAGIPVISIPQKVTTDYCGHIGFDDVFICQQQMQWVANQLGGKGNIVIVMGATGHTIVNARNQGYENVLKNYPNINVLDRQDAKWAMEPAMKITENWLQAYGDKIDAVVSHTDVMAMGVADVIKSAGKNTIVAGVDGYEAAIQYIREGKMHYTSALDMPGLGATAVRTAYFLATSQNPNLRMNGTILVPNIEVAGADAAKNIVGW